MNHLTDGQLSARLDGALTGTELEEVDQHLAGCEECRAGLDALAGQDRSLQAMLDHDPGEPYFEGFAERVEARLGAKPAPVSRAGAAPAEASRRGLASLLRSPRALTLMGAAAAMVVVTALVVVNAPRFLGTGLQKQGVARRTDQLETPRPAPESQLNAPTTTAPPSRDEAAKEAAGTGEPLAQATPPTAPQASGALDDRKNARALAAPTAEELNRIMPQADRASRISPPTGGAAEDRAAKFGAAPSPAAGARPPGTAAPSPGAGARPQEPTRVIEVRRTPQGEELPVKREFAFPPPAAPAQPPPKVQEGVGVKITKHLVAEPAGGAAKRAESTAVAADRDKESAEAEAAGKDSRAREKAEISTAAPAVANENLEAGRIQLCGQVLDPDGRPVAGAQVALADLGKSVTTDAEGRYCLAAPRGAREVSVMALGFEPERRPVTVDEHTGALDVTLRRVAVLGPTWGQSIMKYRGDSGIVPRASLAPESARALQQKPATGLVSPIGAPSTRKTGEPTDAFSPLPDSLRLIAREAQRRAAGAARSRSASEYDAAASQWERLTRWITGRPMELEARHAAALARYHAWELSPNRRRATAAVEALTAYVLRAPSGPERDQATHWLDRVR